MTKFSLEKIRSLLLDGLEVNVLPHQIEQALKLAYYGHEGQFRDPKNPNDNKIPYIVHPVGVAIVAHKLLSYVQLDDCYVDIISACLTHDIIEDTNISPKELAEKTSKRTMEIVLSLTKPMVQPGSTNQQRNEDFFRQIVAAGQTEIFIKICDHCHNLSRPNQTPVHLMEKAIKKGRTTIVRYFDYGNFSEQLKQQYLQYLISAEEENGRIKQQENINNNAWTLESAINYCVQASSRKVLELHDLVQIMRMITNASFVRLESPEHYVDEEIFKKINTASQNLKAIIRKQIKNGIIEPYRLPKNVQKQLSIPAETIYLLDIQWHSSFDRGQSLIIGINEEAKFTWVDIDPLKILVSFLSERLRAQERDFIETLTDELKNLNLNVNVQEVRVLNLSSNDLYLLKELLNYGEFIRKRLQLILEHELINGNGKSDLPIIESRVKSPQSIISKMISRKIVNFSQVDDLIGFRIVCMSIFDAETITNQVISCFYNIFPEAEAINQNAHKSVNINEVSSKDGYKARHVLLALPLKDHRGVCLGCEFQIRTAFQDAWARVSHSISYKNKKFSNKSRQSNILKKALKELSSLCDKSDNIIDELSN